MSEIPVNLPLLHNALNYLGVEEVPTVSLGHIVTFWDHSGRACSLYTPDADDAYILKSYISQMAYFLAYMGKITARPNDLKIHYAFVDDYTEVSPNIASETGLVMLPRNSVTPKDFVRCEIEEYRDYRLIVTMHHIQCSLDSDQVWRTSKTYTIEFSNQHKVEIVETVNSNQLVWMKDVRYGYDLYRNPTNFHYHDFTHPPTKYHYEGIHFWVCDKNVVFLKYYETWVRTTIQWMITSYQQNKLPYEVAIEWNMYHNLKLLTE